MASNEQDLARCQIIVQSAINEIYMFDAKTLKFIDCNESSLKNLGYTLIEIQQLTPLNIKTDYTLRRFKELLQPLYDGKKYIEFITRHKRKDKTFYDVSVKLQLIQEKDRLIFTAILEDITERLSIERSLENYKENLEELIKKRTEELVEAKEMYQTLSRVSPVGIIRINEKNKCVYVNRTWQEFTGLTNDEARGDGWKKAIHPDDRYRVVREWNKCARVESEDFSFEYRMLSTDNTITWVLAQANLVNSGGKGYVGTITNITNNKEILPKILEIRNSVKCNVKREQKYGFVNRA